MMTVFDAFKEAMKQVFPISKTWDDPEWEEMRELVDSYADERRYEEEQSAD